jgi:endoribonuclease Dicer
MNVSYREQVLTMMKFRKGTINCLFATSVAEEGLDIPDCNLVIRFDLYTTLIQYIQSRGRARHANSRFIHMCEDRNEDHAQIIREVRRNEAILKTFCQSLPTDRLLTGNDFDLDYCLKKEKSQRFWRTPANALLDYRTSLMVLANFVSSLPNATESSLHPEYIMSCLNKQFTCEVVLPEASPIRGAIGLPCSTKQVAKCSSAFETCLLLANGKYLDDNLIPIFTKQLPAMRNAILAVDSKKREAYDMRLKPDMWSEGGVPEQLFLTVLSLESPETLGRSSQPLGLLTRSKIPDLPSFMLHFGPGKNSPVQLTSFNQPLQVDAGVLNLVNKFTLCIFNDVFSKEYESDESKMPYFLVPIKSHGLANQTTDASELISWDIIKNVFDHELKWGDHPWDNKTWQDAPDEFFEDKFIVDPWDGSRKLWTVGVDPRFKALDPVPPNSAPRVGPRGTRKVADNIMEYSSSLWAKARAKRTFDENQRVVEARFISLRRNLLDQFDAPDGETPNQCWVILEPLKISSVSSIRSSILFY